MKKALSFVLFLSIVVPAIATDELNSIIGDAVEAFAEGNASGSLLSKVSSFGKASLKSRKQESTKPVFIIFSAALFSCIAYNFMYKNEFKNSLKRSKK